MDLRTERTKRSIINAFLELREKKPLEKITVKELSELAYINKATFYSHYHDIYDLSDQLENEFLSSILKNIPHPDNLILNPRLVVEELTLALTAEHKLLHTLFSGSRAGILAEKLELILKEQIYSQHPEYKKSLEWDILLSFLIQGGFHAYMSHTDEDTSEVIRILGGINDCLKKNYPPVD